MTFALAKNVDIILIGYNTVHICMMQNKKNKLACQQVILKVNYEFLQGFSAFSFLFQITDVSPSSACCLPL